jgi:hypothetical protein
MTGLRKTGQKAKGDQKLIFLEIEEKGQISGRNQSPEHLISGINSRFSRKLFVLLS